MYLQSFVDGQFYALELLPLPIALDIERAKKIFLCESFDLPSCTAKNLVYVVFPVIPAVFLLAKRRHAFFTRAQEHDLDQVKEAFLFDMTQLYPNHCSWSAQTVVILSELGVTVNIRTMNLLDCPTCAIVPTEDVELLCFRNICASDNKTLSFFKSFPDVDVAKDFHLFLSRQPVVMQNFLLLFLSSGLRWRFFAAASQGAKCPLCYASFWSSEHFFTCSKLPRPQNRQPDFSLLIAARAWSEIARICCTCVSVWAHRFHGQDLTLTICDIDTLMRNIVA